MTADTGLAVFREAFRLWLADSDTPFADLVRRSREQLESVVSGSAQALTAPSLAPER